MSWNCSEEDIRMTHWRAREVKAPVKSILVVDDEEGVRETIREVLVDEGYQVAEASNGRAAMEAVRRERPRLVLLDIWMPEVDGVGLLREIKQMDPDARVIMISGHGSIQTAVTATKLGAFDFIEKPFSLDSLLAAVRRALGEAPAADVKGRGRKTKKNRERRGARKSTVAVPRTLKQKTLKKSVVVCGQGLHSGVRTGVILHPFPPNSGVVFSGISADATVRAHLDHVRSTDYATSLQGKGIVVGTVEHFLATLHSYGITNLLIKMHGEIPIMDGSALEFCRLIEEAEVQEQDEELQEIVVDQPYRVDVGDGEWIAVEPSDNFGVRYVLKYPEPVGEQEYTYIYQGPDFFRDEIAPARTFGFVKDIEKLEKMGLANGGRLSNCILIDDDKIVNTELRYAEEFARHKILDILGDFYLFGRPVRGMVTACMTGHQDNITLLRKMERQMTL